MPNFYTDSVIAKGVHCESLCDISNYYNMYVKMTNVRFFPINNTKKSKNITNIKVFEN